MTIRISPAEYVITLNQREFEAVQTLLRKAYAEVVGTYEYQGWKTVVDAFGLSAYDFESDGGY